MKIVVTIQRCKDGTPGRFGGGWDRSIGIRWGRWGWPTVLVDLFSFTIRVEASE